MKKNTVIEVNNVSKSFIKYTQNHQKIFGELFGRDKGESVEVLKNISLTIKKGEKVALIGELESGRSTLQRLIAGYLEPDSGTIKVRGKITTIFFHRLMFDGTFPGKENVALRGSFMGWSKEKIAKMTPEIFEFAELTDLMDRPTNTYKPGSPTRLGFTVETVDKPEVLLYDENFAFGGPQYFDKCVSRLESLIEGEDTTMLMVHANAIVTQRLCTRALVLKDGSIVFDGDVEDAMRYYRRYCKDRSKMKKDVDDDLIDAMSEYNEDEAYADSSGGGMGVF